MVYYLIEQGIEPHDASLSFLLRLCSRHSNWYLIACDNWGDRAQSLSPRHLNVLTLSRQLLSRRPQLIDENCDGILPTPIEEAVRGGLLCQVVNLIQYGADLSGMEGMTLAVIQEKQRLRHPKLWNYYAILFIILRVSTALIHGPLTRYAKLQVAHVPGMPGTFSPPQRISDPDMYHGTCVTRVSWCIPGSLTNRFLWSRCRGKRFRHSPRMHNQQFCVSGKRPISHIWLKLQSAWACFCSPSAASCQTLPPAGVVHG